MSNLILYTSEDGQTRLNLRVQEQTIWLKQLEIAELLQTTNQNVNLHTKNLCKQGELALDSVFKESLKTAADAKDLKEIEQLEAELKKNKKKGLNND